MKTPIRFKPIFKQKVWGGNKLHEILGKDCASLTGESWELSAVPGNVSVVSEGPFKGRTLEDLRVEFGAELMGRKGWEHSREAFPLLFKYIDAKEDLSVQLHPDDSLAKNRHNSLGKTEMWYVMQADPGARLILGFREATDSPAYKTTLDEGRLTEMLREVTVKAGDAFFISPGTVHAIGGGVLLAEIQQSSDVTYRIYDWDRPDVDGSMRELHTELALDAIDYNTFNGQLTPGDDGLLCRSSYFSTHLLGIDGRLLRPIAERESMHVYMVVEGSVRLITRHGSLALQKGETALVPAAVDELSLEAEGASVLEVYLP